MKWLKSLWDKDKFEATLRVGLISLCGYALSIASIPSVVPPSQSLMPGMLACTLSQAFPTLMFAILLYIPITIVMMVGVAGFSTMLLAAGSVSDGLFVGIYGVFTLLMTSLFFGKHYNITNSFANTFISMGGLMGLSYLPLVQEGSLRTVADMWTEKGTENSLAVWRNFLIAICWPLACMILGIVVPPFRTARKILSRGYLPSIFKQVNGVLSGENVDVQALAKSKSNLKKGKAAMVTTFEPRVWHPMEDLVEPLTDVVVATNELIFRSFLVLKWKEGLTQAPNELDIVVLKDTAVLLDKCGGALASNDRGEFEELLDWVDDKNFERMQEVGSADDTAKSESPQSSDANYIYEQALKVRTSTLTYIRTFHGSANKKTAKQQTKSLLKHAVNYVLLLTMPEIRLVKFVEVMFQPAKWSLNKILWSFELSAGFIALMCMSVFWDQYSDFRISPRDDYVGPVYAGWHLMGYAFAWRPSHEGTVKKGIQRILGTCVGGFSGWLGIIVCSWSYDNDAPINPYGLVTWLTIMTMIFAYLNLGAGVFAHFGKDKDHGYIGMYTLMTQALIAIEVYLGAGDKNGLTINRIVATCTGVLMAIVISFLPPHIKGRDPKYTRAYLEALNDAFIRLLEMFGDGNDPPSNLSDKDFKTSLLATADKRVEFAVFALNDADMMHALPFFKVNENLRPLLDDLAVTEATIEHLCDVFGSVISSNDNVAETRSAIKELLMMVQSSDVAILKEKASKGARVSLAVDAAFSIAIQLELARNALDRIEEAS